MAGEHLHNTKIKDEITKAQWVVLKAAGELLQSGNGLIEKKRKTVAFDFSLKDK